MVQLPSIPESATRDALVETPLDDYELIDFGRGRKLERWGPYVIETLDRAAVAARRQEPWPAAWV